MSLLKLRPYQDEAVAAVDQAFAESPAPAALVMATGLGKTVVMGKLIERALNTNLRPVMLVHRDELVHQSLDKIRALCGGATVGVVKGTRFDIDSDVVVASTPTLTNRLDVVRPDRFTATFVDECHHYVAETFRRVVEHFECGRTLGVTATLSRSDGHALGDVWSRVVFERDILFGIAHGYLCDVIGRRVVVEDLDMSTIKRSAGDYQKDALGEAMQHAEAGKVIAKAYREHATLPDGSLRRGIAFWPTVDAARQFADDFIAAGIPTEVITGDTPSEDRRAAYARVRSGETTVLSSCMVLTEGFDEPVISCVVMGRPTGHAGLYIQMAGRGLRPHPGKANCLILDVSGASAKHSLISVADLSGRPDVEVADDETLFEAIERTTAEVEGRVLTGKTRVEQVDLFGASMSAWLRTPAGSWFIPTRYGVVFLAPDPRGDELWAVGKTATPYARTGAKHLRRAAADQTEVRPDQWGWLRTGLPFAYAMAAAEQWAGRLDSTVAQRSASWRKRKGRPSLEQIAYAQRLRIDNAAEMNKAELSDAMSIVNAAKLLDRR